MPDPFDDDLHGLSLPIREERVRLKIDYERSMAAGISIAFNVPMGSEGVIVYFMWRTPYVRFDCKPTKATPIPLCCLEALDARELP